MKLLMPLQLLLVFLIWAASAQPLKIGEAPGTIDLVSPEGLPVAMNNYSERRGTAVLFYPPATRSQMRRQSLWER